MLRTHFKAIACAIIFVLIFAWFSVDRDHVDQFLDFIYQITPRQEDPFAGA